MGSESLEEIKLQWNAQRILKRRNSTHEQIKLHYTSRTHANTTHLPHLPLYPRLPHRAAKMQRLPYDLPSGDPRSALHPLLHVLCLLRPVAAACERPDALRSFLPSTSRTRGSI